MGLPSSVIKWVISGSSASVEGWSFGFWMDTSSASWGTSADLDGNAQWATWIAALTQRMTSDQVVERYDAYQYDGGVLVDHNAHSVSHVGSDSSGQLPLQVSCVLTLRTATPGRRTRGRVYLPTGGFSMMSGGGHLFNSTPVNALVDAFATALTSLGSGGTPIGVVSRVDSAIRPVTAIDADLVPDVQRRRSNQLASSRHSHSV